MRRATAETGGIPKMLQFLPKPKEFTHSSIILTFTFFRGDLRTSLTLDVGEDDTLKPRDQPRDQLEDETKK
jgi:hypothetical protein